MDLPEIIMRMEQGIDIYGDDGDESCGNPDEEEDDVAGIFGGDGSSAATSDAPQALKVDPAKQEELDKYLESLDNIRKKSSEGEIPEISEEIGDALYNVGATYLEMSNGKDALSYFKEAEEIYQAVTDASLTEEERTSGGKQSPLAIDCIRSQGLAAEASGNLDEALTLYVTARDLQLLHSGIYHPLTALSHNNVGALHARLGKFSAAADSFVASVAVHQGADGNSTSLALVSAHVQLGNILGLGKKMVEAEEQYDTAVQVQMALNEGKGESADPIELPRLLEHIAQMQGRYKLKDLAVKTWKKEIAARKSVVGDLDMTIATSCSNLALAFAQNNKWDLALEQYKNAIAIVEDEKNGGAKTNRKLVVAAYGSIANINIGKENAQGALDALMTVVVLNKKLLGEDNEETAASLVALGDFKSNLKLSDEALVDYEQAEVIYESLLGEESLVLADLQIKMGNVYINLNRAWKAMQNYQDALSVRKKVLGKNHVAVGEAVAGIGMAQAALGDFGQAIAAANGAIKIYEKNGLPKDHPLMAQAKKNLESADHSDKHGAVLR
eukprot:CAMPEP_0194325006 /NCGR_PEP_ID=MMETSP0171-20130528/28983_1 /TAXON_ID=218684 /ORGANISM="Corethron pennatum, Strain L29A3" /LENGTH=555 /DNA_ID=CAMNT_0039084013 /DNA_START=258 /DNA_END=1922 /DNA_ORIENTATION=+